MNWQGVAGWTDFEDVYQYALDHVIKDGGKMVEVGCWQGRSIIMMAEKVRDQKRNVLLYALDNWKGAKCDDLDKICQWMEVNGKPLLTVFLDNLKSCQVDHLITPINSDSTEGAALFEDRSLDFVFLDADHSEEAVKRDIAAWLPKIRDGGVLAGHDINRDSVAGPVKEAFDDNWQRFGEHGMCWWYVVRRKAVFD